MIEMCIQDICGDLKSFSKEPKEMKQVTKVFRFSFMDFRGSWVCIKWSQMQAIENIRSPYILLPNRVSSLDPC